jgi:S-adenosylmethionine decarboxylase
MLQIHWRLPLQRTKSVGVHCLLDLWGCPAHLLSGPIFVENAAREAILKSRTSLVQEISHQFHPHGITVVAVLKESHLSIHTWPERHYAAADIFTCGEGAYPEMACKSLVVLFLPTYYRLRKLKRG